MGRTKDERYVLWLYKIAQQDGNLDGTYSRYEVGQMAGLHPKAADTICKLLVQANFIKKDGDEGIRLTPHGIKLCEELLGEKGV